MNTKEEDTERSEELIEEQMFAQGLRKDSDVIQLSFSNRKLSSVTSLSRFNKLNFLYLNGNKLRSIDFLWDNYRLSELYLQNNELVDISGALAHLTNLTIIMAENNQLTRLEETVAEFKAMQALHTLNLSKNPLAQEAEYRHFVIFHVPSLKLLDRHEVKDAERETAFKLYRQDRQNLLDTISFGRRWAAGPAKQTKDLPIPVEPKLREYVEPDSSNSRPVSHVPGRADKRSLMQYSHFDWTKVPKSDARRLQKYEEKTEDPQIVTVRFR